MKSSRFTIFINEADSFEDSAKNYSDRLQDGIDSKMARIKKYQNDMKLKMESDKKLELETKQSQKYNLEQITQKKASYVVTKDPAEQKRIRLELVRLETEKKRIADNLANIQKDRDEFIKSKNEEIKEINKEIQEDKKMMDEFNKTLKAREDARRKETAKKPAPPPTPSPAPNKGPTAGITAESFDQVDDLDKYPFIIRRKFARMEEQIQQPEKKKTLIVNFDKSTKAPFQVKFTERGFLIGETRLSFEFLEAALSKDVNIVLENGSGLVLDAIRMQKILKYKDRV